MQQTAKLQELTQNRLSTGLRVNSAIDNPSSYYTAAALNNRAGDLSALLDAMSQGIQTLKAAQQGLQTASTFLEQAASIANQALETEPVPAKDWFIEQAGENGAVVSNLNELKAALAGDKETIVIYGSIDIENEALSMKDGQKLVGTEYFTGYRGKGRFSQLNFDMNDSTAHTGMRIAGLVSDLTINYKSNYSGSSTENNNLFSSSYKTAVLNNIDVYHDENTYVMRSYESDITFDGHINIVRNNTSSSTQNFNFHKSRVTIKSNSFFNSDATLYAISNTVLNIEDNAKVKTNRLALHYSDSTNPAWGGNSLIIGRNAEIYASDNSPTFFYLSPSVTLNQHTGEVNNYIEVNAGASFYSSWGTWTADTFWNQKSTAATQLIKNLGDYPEFLSTEKKEFPKNQVPIPLNSEKASSLYNNIVNQFDSVIKDSGYQGINLLQNNSLSINFNEDRSSRLEIKGIDASADKLGLKTKEWTNQGDIAQSLAEIASALKQIRSYTQEFGNYYSIVTTREDFTEKLINVLTEGTDKLTLADMNEESANSLMLETRQNLAVNALSLASQAGQSVLKLF